MYIYKVPINKMFHDLKFFIHKQNEVFKFCSTVVYLEDML